VKEILIITNYFPPEIGAASNRIFQLAVGLERAHYKVSVLTPLPNYPKGKIFDDYRGKFRKTAMENNITVHRLWIYASNSKNKIKRLLAMLSYSLSLIWFFAWQKVPKTVIVQSPPLLVAFTSLFFLSSKNRKTILNVSDLWPFAGLELGVFTNNYSYKILEKIEKYNYKRASLILGQSNEILAHVKSFNLKKELFLYRNFPNFNVHQIKENSSHDKKIKLVYAGLLGAAQGIYKLCQELDYSKVQFHIYGAGLERLEIEDYIRTHEECDIIYHGEVSRVILHHELLNYDLTIIPLAKRIYGSVPSKIFEYARLGLPMIYFGGGEGETIVSENKLGWVVEVGDYEALNKIICSLKNEYFKLEQKQNIRNIAMKKFNFDNQLDYLTKCI